MHHIPAGVGVGVGVGSAGGAVGKGGHDSLYFALNERNPEFKVKPPQIDCAIEVINSVQNESEYNPVTLVEQSDEA